ncbi:hypothetical protein ACFYSC_07950 [Streptosporangium sp. NPDC004379]|uniref:hypothetical protein n=1 Tax=Streptosporangium sp. NPDC004379 TaxID=3366189 RepID=UPI0036B9F105
MKRHIAVLACAATAALGVPAIATTAHAQTARAKDPLAALRSQMGGGRGVSFVDKTKVTSPQGSRVLAQRDGVLGFGASGIAASDQTGKMRIKLSDLGIDPDDEDTKGIAGFAKPERVVRVGKASYISGGYFGEFLPEGKTWLRYPAETLGMLGVITQKVNAAEPATLKALLAHATTERPGFYSGKITYGELNKISPWFRASVSGARITGRYAKIKVSWKLFLGSDRLPQRLVTSEASTADDGRSTMETDTRYTGWGAEVSVKAPAPEDVATAKDLQDGATAEVPTPIGR